MRPRTEAALAAAGVTIVLIAAAIIGTAHRGIAVDRNRDPSTFAAGPEGARGLFDALQRIGVDARRYRGRAVQLSHLGADSAQLLAILDPPSALSSPEARAVLDFNRSADLLIAGPGNDALFHCFGYRIDNRIFDSVAVTGMAAPAPRVAATLVATHRTSYADSTRVFDALPFTCTVPAHARTTVLLSSARGPVAVRLDSTIGRHNVILVSDVALLRNQTLRNTSAGVYALQLIDGHYRRVIFDEYHHGYGASGSLGDVVLAASLASPVGWTIWQCAAVGVLALLFGAWRFGPAVPVIVRTRRSSLEHVQALASALSAAHGHDEAIGAIVRGLRRRLVPPAMRTGGDWRAWLAQLTDRADTPATRAALERLRILSQPGQPADSVRIAADTVEDLWQTLHH